MVPERVTTRPRLLFLCQALPYPLDSGVAIRSYHTLRILSRVFDVTALCSGGELRLVFVAELRTSRRARARWRHVLTTLNVGGAIAGVGVTEHPARVGKLAFLRA